MSARKSSQALIDGVGFRVWQQGHRWLWQSQRSGCERSSSRAQEVWSQVPVNGRWNS